MLIMQPAPTTTTPTAAAAEHSCEHSQAAYFDKLARQGIWEDFTSAEQANVDDYFRRWNLNPGDTVLEPGCGSGRLTQRLARQLGNSGHVVACDISGEMIARARQRSYAGRVSLYHCALQQLPVCETAFNRIICFNVFPHFTQPEQILRHLRTLLKPTGQLWICHSNGREAIDAIHADGGREVRRHRLLPLAALQNLLQSAGFEVLDSCDQAHVYWIAGGGGILPLRTA